MEVLHYSCMLGVNNGYFEFSWVLDCRKIMIYLMLSLVVKNLQMNWSIASLSFIFDFCLTNFYLLLPPLIIIFILINN